MSDDYSMIHAEVAISTNREMPPKHEPIPKIFEVMKTETIRQIRSLNIRNRLPRRATAVGGFAKV